MLRTKFSWNAILKHALSCQEKEEVILLVTSLFINPFWAQHFSRCAISLYIPVRPTALDNHQPLGSNRDNAVVGHSLLFLKTRTNHFQPASCTRAYRYEEWIYTHKGQDMVGMWPSARRLSPRALFFFFSNTHDTIHLLVLDARYWFYWRLRRMMYFQIYTDAHDSCE